MCTLSNINSSNVLPAISVKASNINIPPSLGGDSSFLHRPPLMESTAEVVHRLAVTPISNVPTPRSPAGCPVPPGTRDPITIMCTWKENYGDQASVGRVFYVATAQECLPSDTCLRSFCGRRRSGRPPRNAENNAK